MLSLFYVNVIREVLYCFFILCLVICTVLQELLSGFGVGYFQQCWFFFVIFFEYGIHFQLPLLFVVGYGLQCQGVAFSFFEQ